MNHVLPLFLLASLSLISCSHSVPSCEEVSEINAQRRECDDLEKRIKQSDSVVVRTNLQEIYDKQCVDIRFYRDSFADERVCSSQKQQAEVKKAEQKTP